MKDRSNPKVLRFASDYSLQDRHRIRFALADFRQQYGLSFQRILDDMANVIGTEVYSTIKDRQQIREYLQGSEPRDEKIKIFHQYLKKVAPTTIENLYLEDRVEELGHLFTSLYLPLGDDGDALYRRSIRAQICGRLEGLYAEFSLDVVNSDEYVAFNSSIDQVKFTPRFLFLRKVESQPYMIAYTVYANFGKNWWTLSKFLSDYYENEKKVYAGLYLEEALQAYFTCLEGTMPDLPEYDHLGDPRPHLDVTPDQHEISLTIESRGILVVDEHIAFLQLRDVLRRYPAFSKIRFENPSNLEAGFVAFTELATGSSNYYDSHLNRLPLVSKFDSFFHKIRNPNIINYFNKISWEV